MASIPSEVHFHMLACDIYYTAPLKQLKKDSQSAVSHSFANANVSAIFHHLREVRCHINAQYCTYIPADLIYIHIYTHIIYI